MNHIKIASQTQADVRIFDKIDEFFNHFHVSTMLHRCSVRKRHGYSVRSLIKPVFSLPFLGKNFFRGIVINDDVPFGKDAAHDLLKGSRSNWRRFLLTLGVRLYRFFDRLTSNRRESVLIIDGSTYDRSRSKKEFLGCAYNTILKNNSRLLFLGRFYMIPNCKAMIFIQPVQIMTHHRHDHAKINRKNRLKRQCQNPAHRRHAGSWKQISQEPRRVLTIMLEKTSIRCDLQILQKNPAPSGIIPIWTMNAT